ncbi:hypothetical protein KRP22_011348 [Phytophthora ramorum]|nr:hypothetical protein KRP22_10549 [Phytophthora ramorum]
MRELEVCQHRPPETANSRIEGGQGRGVNRKWILRRVTQMNDGDGKRKLRSIDSSSEDDGCDLLRRLDEERLREHHQWFQKRCLAVRKRAGNAGDAVAVDGLDFGGISDGSGCAANEDTEAAQDIAAVLRECWSAFRRTRGAQGVPDKTHSTEVVMNQDGGHTTEDDGDL